MSFVESDFFLKLSQSKMLLQDSVEMAQTLRRATNEHEITIQDLLRELLVLFVCDSNCWNSNII